MEKLLVYVVLLTIFIVLFTVKYFVDEHRLSEQIKEARKKMYRIVHPKHGSMLVNKNYYKEYKDMFIKYGWKIDEVE